MLSGIGFWQCRSLSGGMVSGHISPRPPQPLSPRVNSDSAIRNHDIVKRIVLKAAGQLSETDTLES